MSVVVKGLNSDVVARGLLAACDVLDVPPSALFAPDQTLGAAPRRLTGAALLSVWPRKGVRDGATAAVADLLGVTKTAFAPTGSAANFTSDQLLTVSDALRAAGLDPRQLEAVRASKPRAAKTTSVEKPVVSPKPAIRVAAAPAPAPAEPAPVAVRPMKANLRRWTRQFLQAGWSPREVAKLFDLHPAQVKAVRLEARS